MKRVGVLAFTLLLAACATAPKPVGGPIAGSPSVREAALQLERVKGARVRWGGTIVSVQNEANDTIIEVVARELDEEGEPKAAETSDGRFLARISGFLDPELYPHGRRFTVTGTLADPVTRSIGNFPYRYPVVDVDRYHLWEPERIDGRLQRPFYDPFYDPWYPFYRPWPYNPYWPYW